MSKYKIELVGQTAEDGKTYWTAKYPSVSGCIGCGDTPDEAIAEAEENLEVYLEYLQAEGIEAPKEMSVKDYSGKIALRISKSTHKKLVETSKDESISVNMLINNAIEHYLGSRV